MSVIITESRRKRARSSLRLTTFREL